MSNCEIMNFESKDEFMKYYNEHKEEMDTLTTKELNNKFKINEHKIAKNKKKIILRPNSPKNTNKSNKSNAEMINVEKSINHMIDEYEKQLNQLKDLKNKIISEKLYESIQPTTQTD